jgi:hypothetical protein
MNKSQLNKAIDKELKRLDYIVTLEVGNAV